MRDASASCGCIAGDDYNGWLEIRSSYCISAEQREYGIYAILLRRVPDKDKRKEILERLRK